MSARVIFEDDHIRLYHLAGEKPVALVTFAAFAAINRGKSFRGLKFCKDEGIECFGFMAKGISMYPPESVLKAIGSGAINPGKPIVTYGGSSGSSPALIYAGALNAAGAIATAPMYAIDPALIPEDKRFLFRYVPALHRGRKVSFNGMTGNIVLVFDPTEQGEAYQAKLIGQEYAGHRLQNLHVHNVGHAILPNFNDRQLFLALIDHAANGGDITEIFKLARMTKKTKQYYACTLARKLIRHRKPKLALRVLDLVPRNGRAIPDAADRLRRAELSADAYMALAMPAAAAARIEEAIALRPRNPGLFGKLANALDADGRIEPAVKAWRTAIEYAANEPQLRKRLQTAMQRAIRNSHKRKTSRGDRALEHCVAAE